MARYIDADMLIAKIKPAQAEDETSCMLLGDVRRFLKEFVNQAPTADVVQVVRCENCKRRVDYEGKIMCNKFGHKFQGEWYGLKATTKDHFCSYGERKE